MKIELTLLDWPDASHTNVQVTLTGKDQQQRVVASSTLKMMLFAWHEASYYGTSIEEVRTGEGPGIVLPLEWLWDFLFASPQMGLLKINYDDLLDRARNEWTQLIEEVHNHQFRPDLNAWSEGGSLYGKHASWLRVAIRQASGSSNPEWQRWNLRLMQLDRMSVEDRQILTGQCKSEELESVIYDDGNSHRIRLVAHDPGGWLYEVSSDGAGYLSLVRTVCRHWHWQDDRHWIIPFEKERSFLKEQMEWLKPFGFELITDELERCAEPAVWTVEATVRPKTHSSGKNEVRISQWLDWDWTILLNGIEWPRESWQDWLSEPRGWIRVSGRLFTLVEEQIDELAKVLDSILNPAPRTVSDWLKAQLEPEDPNNPVLRKIRWKNDEMLDRWFARLSEPVMQGAEPFQAPDTFNGTLRPYQEAGCQWLWRMRDLQLGALLADEMGLGKTVQVIAHLLRLKKSGLTQPSLLICPTSVLGNWQKELHKFAPELTLMVHYGSQRCKEETFAGEAAAVDLVMTTYGTAQLDAGLLQTVLWDTMVLDEAQQIKNPFTKQTRAIRHMKHQHAIAMTGTPIENRVVELWSIMDVLNSGYLGHYRSFAKDWRKADDVQMRALRAWVHPFLLRRRKADPEVALSLPDKTIIPEYVPLSLEQAAAYERTVQSCLGRLRETTGMIRRGLVLSTLTKLKQICNYSDDELQSSPKIDRVLELVEAIREDGEAVLLFTQFVQTGELLRQRLKKRFNEQVLFLHGSLTRKQRDDLVSTFQSGEPDAPKLFVLSLRAGGYGLNLTAANHVIHVDRWWNPAVEQQASDRVHRIGQSRNVRIYRMITMGTLEERIDEMLEEKEMLAERVLESTGEGWLVDQPVELLEKIFRLDEKRATFSSGQPFIESSRTGREK